ncbi:MAG TPA: MFS transporter [Candidatus Dormibacteraeota bacterium]|nr:MFS transporter [Candidatus Dormibacteraeota bacterium]
MPVGWRAPLQVPRFRALWLGGLLSWYGDFLTLPALVIICYKLGGEVGVGLLFLFESAPLLVFLPIGGHLGDRGDRRRRLAALDLVRAALVCLTIVGAQGHLLVAVLIAAGVSRAASALYDPGRRRLVSVLLPQSLVPAGSSLLSVVSESALIVAPGLGALLLFYLPPTMLIAVDGATFLVAACMMAQVGPQPAAWVLRAYTHQRVWPTLRRGFEMLLFDPTTRLFAFQAALGAALASVIQVYFVPLAHYIFHAHTNQVGLMYVLVGGASIAFSAIALRLPQVRRKSVVIIGYIHLVVAAAVGVMFGAWLVVAALVIFAGSGALQEVWGFNRVQTKTPSEGIGQAMGAAVWFLCLGRALGALAATLGTSHLDRASFMLVLATSAVLICLFISFIGRFNWRRNPATWPPGGPPLPF